MTLSVARAPARCVVLVAVLLCGSLAQAKEPGKDASGRVTARLNGVNIVIDARSGSVLRLSTPSLGTLLDTTADAASAVDVAYPVEAFRPLRLASRYSQGARVTKGDGQIAIHWDELGASRTFVTAPGKVSATVVFKAAEDCKSVVMNCVVNNHSRRLVRQVLFPDLLGLVPTSGRTATECRSGGEIIRPFVMRGKVLIVVLNTEQKERRIELSLDLAPWLESVSGRYRAQSYDGQGRAVETGELSTGRARLTTGATVPLDLWLLELTPG